jgi:hypothetical protein
LTTKVLSEAQKRRRRRYKKVSGIEPANRDGPRNVTAKSQPMLPAGTTQHALNLLFPKEDRYITNPNAWITDELNEWAWSKQQEICRSVVENKYTAVKACHGPGKSFIAARIFAWFLRVHRLGSAFGVSSAPTAPQIGAILWRELRRVHVKAKLPGRITLDNQWYMSKYGKRNTPNSEDQLIAHGRKPADYDEQAFQGIHDEYVIAVLDEAGGIPKQLFDAVDSILTTDDCRALAIGNPDDPGSHFATICAPGSGWNVISISAFDTPNFTGEQVPPQVAKVLVSPGWVDERRRSWGEGSPLWTSKVLGEFPDVSDETLFPPSIIRRACERNLPGTETGRYGADIARFGTDKSVVYRNRGFQIRHEAEWAKQDTMASAGQLALILNRHPIIRPPMVIDVVGLGSGVYDRLKEQNYNVVPFASSERAFQPAKYTNRRSEVYWTFRELCESGSIDLDPEDEQLLSEMGSIKWGLDSSGRIYIESKDDMKKRGMPSPDHADSAVMSTVMNTTAREILEMMNQRPKSVAGDILTRPM